MKTTFTKANLMTGDMIICRNGKTATIMLDTPIGNIARFHTDKDSFSYLDTRYTDELVHTSHENMDIVQVYRVDPTKLDSTKIGDVIANPEKMKEFGKVVYERKEVENVFKLEDLATGDMLVHRNGKVSTVYKNTPIGDITRYHTEYDSFSYLRRFDGNTLKHESNNSFDIVAVFRANIEDPTKIGDLIGNPTKMLTAENLLFKNIDEVSASWVYKEASGDFLLNFAESVPEVTEGSNDDRCGDCPHCGFCTEDSDYDSSILEALRNLFELLSN